MKRINNLYDNMISYSNILLVFNRVKSKCHNKNKLMKFIRYKNCNLMDILIKLKNGNYKFSNYHIFLIHEKKYRIIMSENISDKIVNQMISYFIILPSFKCLIDENIATRINKGSSYGYKLFEKYVYSIGTNKDIYVLRIDIKKYFYNINHNLLYDMLERRIKDKKSLNILKDILSLTDYDYINKSINNLVNNEIVRINKLNISIKEKNRLINELKSIPLYREGYGLSIGCLSNQLMAIFYLNDLDHYIKEELKCNGFIRFMDDMYILSDNKKYLEYCFDNIRNKLKLLDLDVNKKSGIYRLKEGVNFLGYTYKIVNNRLLIRYDNTTIRNIKKKLNKLYNDDFNFYYGSVCSYKGYFIRCNTKLYFDKYSLVCINNKYDKYIMIKNRYNDYIVFIKYKNRYYTYDNDLIMVNNLFNKRHKWFNNKLLTKLDRYVILIGNEIIFIR